MRGNCSPSWDRGAARLWQGAVVLTAWPEVMGAASRKPRSARRSATCFAGTSRGPFAAHSQCGSLEPGLHCLQRSRPSSLPLHCGSGWFRRRCDPGSSLDRRGLRRSSSRCMGCGQRRFLRRLCPPMLGLASAIPGIGDAGRNPRLWARCEFSPFRSTTQRRSLVLQEVAGAEAGSGQAHLTGRRRRPVAGWCQSAQCADGDR